MSLVFGGTRVGLTFWRASYRSFATKSLSEEPPKLPEWAKQSISCQSPSPRPPKRPQTLSRKLDTYMELSKPRLSVLVVLSAMSSYALAPSGTSSVVDLIFLSMGTALCSASANAINMGREPEFDRQMTRTQSRPVASGRLSVKQAFCFAGLTGVSGVITLAYGTNDVVASLGLLNIILYGWTYTSLKRKHIVNTWVGAVVGAIPPLMGWATCASLWRPEPWILAGILYSWQFPHFMSLSYSIADEYRRAGYVMSAWKNSLLTARVALRHSIAMFPLCFAASWMGLCDPFFALDSSIANGWLVYTSYKFWNEQRLLSNGQMVPSKNPGEHKKNSRLLFWASVIHLPAILVLAMLHKKGQWDWLFEKTKE